MRRVASFDVFDTVLTRAVGDPQSVFLLLGLRLGGTLGCSPEAFARARLAADRHAYAKTGRDGRVTLSAIHAELGLLLGLDEPAQAALAAAEMDLERELLRPVPAAAALVGAARIRGERVVYLSDMYLPSSFLVEQLRRHGLWHEGDALHVSGERAASKRSGRLYRLVAEQEGVPTALLTHHGNDPIGDGAAARRAGARIHPVPDANPTGREQLLESGRWSSEGFASALAGAARLARLTVPAAPGHDSVLRDVAAAVAAPLLTGYVLWVLGRARRLGIQRLHFLSRDGQVLLEIARRLARKLDLDIDLRYLYGSRQAWNVATAADGLAEQAAWLFTHSAGASLRGLLARVALAPEAVRGELAELGLLAEDWSRPLSRGEREGLIAAVVDGPLTTAALASARAQRPLVLDHLRQSGVFDGVRSGIVDVIARGSQHRTLCTLALDEGVATPTAFYVGRQRHGPLLPDAAETYLFDEVTDVGIPRFSGRDVLLLAFCAADHGTVTGYRRVGERVEPVLAEQRNEHVLAWGLQVVRRTMLAFADQLVLEPDWLRCPPDVREVTVAVAERFWQAPSAAEARAWGAFPFEYGSGDDVRWNTVGAPRPWAYLISTSARRQRHWSTWSAASLASSRADVKAALWTVQAARTLSRRWLGA